jgi:hypothetical protein
VSKTLPPCTQLWHVLCGVPTRKHMQTVLLHVCWAAGGEHTIVSVSTAVAGAVWCVVGQGVVTCALPCLSTAGGERWGDYLQYCRCAWLPITSAAAKWGRGMAGGSLRPAQCWPAGGEQTIVTVYTVVLLHVCCLP